jgi:hypothetical protein
MATAKIEQNTINLENEMKTLNLTQHAASTEQVIAGVFDLVLGGECLASSFGFKPEQFGYYKTLSDCLTFDELPSPHKMWSRAVLLAAVAKACGAESAMIGGAPFFMPVLELALSQRCIQPLYAFSKRESVEETLPDGSVKKTNVFKHVGFVKGEVFPLGVPSDDMSEE